MNTIAICRCGARLILDNGPLRAEDEPYAVECPDCRAISTVTVVCTPLREDAPDMMDRAHELIEMRTL